MAAQMIECQIQLSFRWSSKEMGSEDASHFKWQNKSKYFELIVKWFMNESFANDNQTRLVILE